MTLLCEVRDFLNKVSPDFVFSSGFARAHPWPGSLYKVAFEPAPNISASELIANIADATFGPLKAHQGDDITYVIFTLNSEAHLELVPGTWSGSDADNFTVMFNNMKNEYAAKTGEKTQRTKQQKMQEYETEAKRQKAADFQNYVNTYQTRLLKLMVGFAGFNLQIQSVNGGLHLFAKSNYRHDETIMRFFSVEPKKDVDNPEWEEDEFQLTCVERFLANELEEARKAKEACLAKQVALAKLTNEEKRLLGLL